MLFNNNIKLFNFPFLEWHNDSSSSSYTSLGEDSQKYESEHLWAPCLTLFLGEEEKILLPTVNKLSLETKGESRIQDSYSLEYKLSLGESQLCIT